MLLEKIDEEYMELYQIMGYENLFKSYKDLYYIKGNCGGLVISWGEDIRKLTRVQVVLNNKKFVSKIVQMKANECLSCIDRIFTSYDMVIANAFMEEDMDKISDSYEDLYSCIDRLKYITSEISIACNLINDIIDETWEPLPNDAKEESIENVVVSSETRSMSLNDVARDVGNLDNFFKNISLIINQDQNQSNNIYLRRVETGSLTVAVSCAMQAAPIIAFIFWCVKLYQKTEKRYLDNADRKLEIIDKSINEAKEILKIDPDNMEANESIQRCAKHLLNFLENNPIGFINGEPYDIGIEKLKIEDKGKNE